jgi:hypothetical protein
MSCIFESICFESPSNDMLHFKSIEAMELAGGQGLTHADSIHQLLFSIGLLLESETHAITCNDLLNQVY